MISITECPRDAMQGIHQFIPTELKINYIQSLLKVGFDVLDCASFVSPKAIPQMSDSKEVISSIIDKFSTKILTIVANTKGADMAKEYDVIDFLGYPFSISETFQQRNTNKSISEALVDVEYIHNLCEQNNKRMEVGENM